VKKSSHRNRKDKDLKDKDRMPTPTGAPLSGKRTTLGDLLDRALERMDARLGR
jgi:hypothetical protein